jgi:hypothetical protein
MLGLKGVIKKINKFGCIRFRLRVLRKEIKFAFQRAYFGFDDYDVYFFHQSLTNRIVALLKEYLKLEKFSWYDEEINGFLDDDYVRSIIEEIIMHFEKSDVNGTEDVFDFNVSEMFINQEEYFKKYKEYNDKCFEHQQKGFELLSKYFTHFYF